MSCSELAVLGSSPFLGRKREQNEQKGCLLNTLNRAVLGKRFSCGYSRQIRLELLTLWGPRWTNLFGSPCWPVHGTKGERCPETRHHLAHIFRDLTLCGPRILYSHVVGRHWGRGRESPECVVWLHSSSILRLKCIQKSSKMCRTALFTGVLGLFGYSPQIGL